MIEHGRRPSCQARVGLSEDDGTDRGLVPALALRQFGDPEDQFVGGDVLIEFDGGTFIGVEDSLTDDLGILRVVPIADLELASGVAGLDLDLADGRLVLELDEQTDTGFEVAELRRVVAIGVPRTLGLRNHVLGLAVVLLTITLWVERFDGCDLRRLGLRRLLRLRRRRLLARRGGLCHRGGLILAGGEVADHDAHADGGDDHETEHQPQEGLARGRGIAIVRTRTTGRTAPAGSRTASASGTGRCGSVGTVRRCRSAGCACRPGPAGRCAGRRARSLRRGRRTGLAVLLTRGASGLALGRPDRLRAGSLLGGLSALVVDCAGREPTHRLRRDGLIGFLLSGSRARLEGGQTPARLFFLGLRDAALAFVLSPLMLSLLLSRFEHAPEEPGS